MSIGFILGTESPSYRTVPEMEAADAVGACAKMVNPASIVIKHRGTRVFSISLSFRQRVLPIQLTLPRLLRKPLVMQIAIEDPRGIFQNWHLFPHPADGIWQT
jgi:hypothetical protein